MKVGHRDESEAERSCWRQGADSPLAPLEGAQPCRHFSLGLLAPGTVMEYTAVVLSPS